MGDRNNVFAIYCPVGNWDCCIPGFRKEIVIKALNEKIDFMGLSEKSGGPFCNFATVKML